MRALWVPCCAALAFLAIAVNSSAQPADAGKPVFERVCSTCHTLQIAISSRRTRSGWQDTMEAMVSKQGAKIAGDEFTPILNYLAAAYGRDVNSPDPGPTVLPAPALAGRGASFGGRGAPGGVGSDDKHVVDPVASDRGKKVYAAECINCHGTHARGGDNGADLVRSVVVLHDRYGNEIGPFLRKGHPTQTTGPANLTQAQIEDLSHFVHYELYQTMRSALDVQNVLTGDAKAGAVYFTGEGRCGGCHSPTGDLAGIGRRYSPVNLQQRFLFPEGGGRGGRGGRGAVPTTGKQVTVTVTPPSGAAVTGVVVSLDDFNVALRDASGDYHSFKRTPSLKVVKNNPFAAHEELLDRITDTHMHDVVAYLEGLK
jgi:cytochrome c oxidase cbb3-type subunit 3